MKIKISLLNQKGGVGKSTTAMLLALALKEAFFKVYLNDQDPQGSLARWAENIAKIPLVKSSFEVPIDGILITDTAGHLDLEDDKMRNSLISIIKNSDRIILVSEMSLLSIQATAPMASLIRNNIQPSAKAFTLFNKVRSGTLIGKQDQKALAEKFGIEPLSNFLPLASAYEQVCSFGWRSVSGKERGLVLDLAKEILK